jgi:AraC-like DNA-binding protein
MIPAATEVFKSDERFRPGMHVFVNRAYEAFKLSKHTHDAIEISYVTEGTGFQYMNDATLQVKQGDIFLLPMGTAHVYRPPSPAKVGSLGVINCVFRPEALRQWPDFPPAGSALHQVLYEPHTMERPWFHLYDKDSAFADLFYNLLSEYRQRQPGYEVVVHSLFSQLIALLHRHSVMTGSYERRSPKIEDALQYIKHHCFKDITLKQVAEHSFLSVSHLQRLLKQATGSSFTSYVQHLRVKTCCELLKTTSMTVQQIANTVGYHDMKHFHELFRHKTGMTPQEYRKNDKALSREGE